MLVVTSDGVKKHKLEEGGEGEREREAEVKIGTQWWRRKEKVDTHYTVVKSFTDVN